MAMYQEGRHTCEIVGQEVTVLGQNETPCVVLYIIPDGGVEKRRLKLWVNKSENVRRTGHQLSMIGWRPPSLATLEGDPPQCDLRGQKVILECYHDSYNGRDYDDWRFPKQSEQPEAPKGLAKNLDIEYADELASVSPKAELSTDAEEFKASMTEEKPKDDIF